MRYKIELTTMHDVEEFTALVQQVDCDVRLIGKDEHGSGWELSAKSTLCVFLLGGHIQHILRASQEIDWSTIYCECKKDIYPLIRKFVKAGVGLLRKCGLKSFISIKRDIKLEMQLQDLIDKQKGGVVLCCIVLYYMV